MFWREQSFCLVHWSHFNCFSFSETGWLSCQARLSTCSSTTQALPACPSLWHRFTRTTRMRMAFSIWPMPLKKCLDTVKMFISSQDDDLKCCMGWGGCLKTGWNTKYLYIILIDSFKNSLFCVYAHVMGVCSVLNNKVINCICHTWSLECSLLSKWISNNRVGHFKFC